MKAFVGVRTLKTGLHAKPNACRCYKASDYAARVGSQRFRDNEAYEDRTLAWGAPQALRGQDSSAESGATATEYRARQKQ